MVGCIVRREVGRRISPFAAVVAIAIGAGMTAIRPASAAEAESPRIAAMTSYSASGTHQCRSASGEGHTCVVTGLAFSNCNDATSSLKARDCCPTSQLCTKDPQSGEQKCRSGGTSGGFTLNHCIPERGLGRD